MKIESTAWELLRKDSAEDIGGNAISVDVGATDCGLYVEYDYEKQEARLLMIVPDEEFGLDGAEIEQVECEFSPYDLCILDLLAKEYGARYEDVRGQKA